MLSVDEKSQIQALDRTQPVLPMKSGASRRVTATYKRNDTTCLLAALAVHSGAVSGRCVDSSTYEKISFFEEVISKKSLQTSACDWKQRGRP